jgi:hypothetical protein
LNGECGESLTAHVLALYDTHSDMHITYAFSFSLSHTHTLTWAKIFGGTTHGEALLCRDGTGIGLVAAHHTREDAAPLRFKIGRG